MSTFNSSYAVVDNMELETLLALLSVYDKINDSPDKTKKGQTFTVLD